MFNYLFGFDARRAIYGVTVLFVPDQMQRRIPSIPACDIYYNNNTTFDRQIAGFGEVSYAFTDWMKLTLGERVARTTFTLNHYADGYENYGPERRRAADQKQTPNHAARRASSFQVDPNRSVLLHLRQGLPRRRRQPAAAVLLRRRTSPPPAFRTARRSTTAPTPPRATRSAPRTASATGCKIATSVYYIKWNNIQQNIYVAGACGLQFTDNLGTAVA